MMVFIVFSGRYVQIQDTCIKNTSWHSSGCA